MSVPKFTASLLLTVVMGCSAAAPSRVVVTLQGEPVSGRAYSMKGTPGSLEPGDVISVRVPQVSEHGTSEGEATLLTVGDEFRWDLSTPRGRPGVIIARTGGSTESIVGVHVYRESRLINPLEGLSDAEVRGLRGICLEVWSEAIAERLRHVDPIRACVKLVNEAARPDALRTLPNGIRYLALQNPRGTPVGPLSSFDRLIFLKAEGNVDLSGLAACRRLAHLDLQFAWGGTGLSLADLPSLRSLNVAGREDPDLLAFLNLSKDLRWIDLSDTAVDDLGPLAALTELHTVIADGTRVRALPQDGFQALTRMTLFRTGLDASQARPFAERHPRCALSWNYTQELTDALKGVDRVRVRTEGTCPDLDRRILFETSNPREIRRLISALSVIEPRMKSRCGCCGRPSIEFYKEGRLAVTLGIHHGVLLRWPSSPWTSDADLTPEAGEALCRWLADHGVTEPLEERRKP